MAISSLLEQIINIVHVNVATTEHQVHASWHSNTTKQSNTTIKHSETIIYVQVWRWPVHPTRMTHCGSARLGRQRFRFSRVWRVDHCTRQWPNTILSSRSPHGRGTPCEGRSFGRYCSTIAVPAPVMDDARCPPCKEARLATSTGVGWSTSSGYKNKNDRVTLAGKRLLCCSIRVDDCCIVVASSGWPWFEGTNESHRRFGKMSLLDLMPNSPPQTNFEIGQANWNILNVLVRCLVALSRLDACSMIWSE